MGGSVNGTSREGADPRRACARLAARMRSRRLARWTVLLLCGLLGGLVLSSAPALALSQRGHVFGFSYGSTGEGQLLNPGEGQLLNPGAVAVNNATGDVYVVDRGHGRIVQFGPHGEFISAWGWGVKKGSAGKEYEVCDAGECNSSGVSGSGKDEFNQNVQAIAVDNCTRSDSKPCTEEEDPSVGDVYVAKESGKEEREAIVKFTPGGKPLEEISKVEWKEAGEKRPVEEELEAEEAYGLTVAPKGTVWLYYDEELFGLSDRALKEATESQIPLSVGLTGNRRRTWRSTRANTSTSGTSETSARLDAY